MYEVAKQTQERMNKSIDALRRELSSLRAGKANPQMLDRVMVDYYGTPTPIQQVGNISVPEPRVLLISVWDDNAVPEVERAILASNLGLNPNTDGKAIRLVLPELSEERREELVKLARQQGEESKITIRNIRRDGMDELDKQEKDKQITEDQLHAFGKEVQDVTDEAVASIDELVKNKEAEILEI